MLLFDTKQPPAKQDFLVPALARLAGCGKGVCSARVVMIKSRKTASIASVLLEQGADHR